MALQGMEAGGNGKRGLNSFDQYIISGNAAPVQPTPPASKKKVRRKANKPGPPQELECEKKIAQRCCREADTVRCESCTHAKQLSDDGRACGACCRRGKADDCVLWDKLRAFATKSFPKIEKKAEIERVPLTRVYGVEYCVPMTKESLGQEGMRSILGLKGMANQTLARIMGGMTPRLQQQIQAMLGMALDASPWYTQMKAQAIKNLFLGASAPRNRVQLVDVCPSQWYTREFFQPDGSVDMQVNHRMATMGGLHPEEFCARFAQKELVHLPSAGELTSLLNGLQGFTWLATSEIPPFGSIQKELYFMLAFDIQKSMDPSSSYGRLGKLVVRASVLPLGPGSQALCIEKFMTPITPEEFDNAQKLDPSMNVVRVLERAAGDERSGAELLSDYVTEARTTLAGLRETEEGRARLSRVSDAVDDILVPQLKGLCLKAKVARGEMKGADTPVPTPASAPLPPPSQGPDIPTPSFPSSVAPSLATPFVGGPGVPPTGASFAQNPTYPG
eukprot:CAMPEP_0177708622 /NCGR_PEP_ID=MMETSP0484_2-20121128/10374_1 /TAXON_ID=354590 /ORGANISM="Rhodomonas lens, Strain RHODO" /LENGTH=503 /DNA_ID=CAMNT_0019220197 /DNA_START=19 /DNA_END=1526 /DNA_ORIENTATION=-